MNLKILLLEDIATDAELIERELTKGKISFVSECVSTKQEYIDAIDTFKPDIILSDHSLAGFDSLAALEIARQKKHDICFILVTGTVSEEFAVTCIKSGADDYILKSNLARLPSAIKASLEKRSLETENIVIKKLHDEIEKKNEVLNYLNHEKDRFVGMVSHDLQNDVSAMMLTLGILEKNTEIKNESQLKYIKRLRRSVANMYRLLRNFLSVNRIQQGIINPDYTPVNIGMQVEEMVEEYSDIAAIKNLKLNYINECKDDLLNTDGSYIGIIIDNLISNAIKYSPRGGKIDIKVSKTENRFSFEIKDQGSGIPASDMAKLYGRFQKLTARPTGGEPSNGLGLSIVKDLVDALKATIECKSEDGKGTTFTVRF
ncbi:MAG TPA: hybrid sensor histidine kinase/response regulator [Bacteroidia bacterium]|jgi:signal transduction histidine kinase|nr:hybrid sensor histidine kinase/response regulator [Bacteroidia bacterium]